MAYHVVFKALRQTRTPSKVEHKYEKVDLKKLTFEWRIKNLGMKKLSLIQNLKGRKNC